MTDTKKLDDLQEIYGKKQDQFLEYMKDRTELLQQQELDQDDGMNDIYIKSYLDDFQPDGDYENTARESGYLNGLYDAIQLLKGKMDIDDFIV